MRCPKCNAQGYRIEIVELFKQYHCSSCGKVEPVRVYGKSEPVKKPMERVEIQAGKIYSGLQAQQLLQMTYYWFRKAVRTGLLSGQTVKRGKKKLLSLRGSDLLSFRAGWSDDYRKRVEVK